MRDNYTSTRGPQLESYTALELTSAQVVDTSHPWTDVGGTHKLFRVGSFCGVGGLGVRSRGLEGNLWVSPVHPSVGKDKCLN